MEKALQLSSSWTKFTIFFALFMFFGLIPVLFWAFPDAELNAGLIIIGIVHLTFLGFVVYYAANLAIVKVVGEKISFQKLFRPAKLYSFDKIGFISSFHLKRMKFTTVSMRSETGKKEKYIILNNNGILSFEKKDAQQMLYELVQLGTEKLNTRSTQ